MARAKKEVARALRQTRVRRRLRGTDQRPRLCVYRSNRHVYVQVISDETGRTLAAASSLQLESGPTGNRTAAHKVGELVAAQCKERSISEVVFDRNGFLYHGLVKEIAEGARAAGLKF